MRRPPPRHAPFVYRASIRLAAAFVPPAGRSAWLGQWLNGLNDWWILAERGELTNEATALASRYCRGAFADALEARFNRARFLHWLRGPSALLAAAAAALAVLALFSRGFAFTRSLLHLAATYGGPPPGARYDPRGDTLMAYFAPVVLACLIGAVMLSRLGPRLRGLPYRYAAFFAAKTFSLLLVLVLAWVEVGFALRAHLVPEPLRILGGGIGFLVLFLLAFGVVVRWSASDQRHRCPICLHRLAMPVSLGSWGSVFEPASTEMLCEDGHGSLSLSESGCTDRWTALDASWRELFETTRV